MQERVAKHCSDTTIAVDAHLLLGTSHVYFQHLAHNAIHMTRLISTNIKLGALEKIEGVLPSFLPPFPSSFPFSVNGVRE
jgi:hypothetical protein